MLNVDIVAPGLVIYRVAGPLSYANAEIFMDQVLSLINREPSLRWFVLRFDSGDEVDYVAARMLAELVDRARMQGVTLAFAGMPVEIRDVFSTLEMVRAIGAERMFTSADSALAAYNESYRENSKIL